MLLKFWKMEISKHLVCWTMTRDCHILLLLILRLTHSLVRHPRKSNLVTMVMKEVLLTYRTFHAGEMFTFGYSHTPPYITYRVISKDGFMHDPVPITISDPIMMHDFAITENYAIFMDLPLYFRPKVCYL